MEFTEIKGLLTTKQLAKLFAGRKGKGVTPLSITKWRNNRGLPFVILPGDGRPAIRFSAPKVARWARDNGYEFKAPDMRAGRKRKVACTA